MAIGNYKDSPFVTGNHFPTAEVNGLKTEILDYGKGIWVEADEYPFSNNNRYHRQFSKLIIKKINFRFAYYATASINESVYIIGGITGGSPDRSTTIAEYKNGKWNYVGDLVERRYSHEAISLGSTIMVVGGGG